MNETWTGIITLVVAISGGGGIWLMFSMKGLRNRVDRLEDVTVTKDLCAERLKRVEGMFQITKETVAEIKTDIKVLLKQNGHGLGG